MEAASSGFVPPNTQQRSGFVPPNTMLLVGVMSYRAPEALARRNAMRSMLRDRQRRATGAALRFVISDDTPDSDASEPDMLTFSVNESTRVLGTYLLNNAYFRYAVALRPRIPFIARADDDSYFDMNTVLAEMLAASCAQTQQFSGLAWWVKHYREFRFHAANDVFLGPCDDPAAEGRRAPEDAALGWVPSRHFVYGHFKEWYMWARGSMQATCFDFSDGRHKAAVGRLNDVAGDVLSLPRFQRECLHPDLAGPFPFGTRATDGHEARRAALGSTEQPWPFAACACAPSQRTPCGLLAPCRTHARRAATARGGRELRSHDAQERAAPQRCRRTAVHAQAHLCALAFPAAASAHSLLSRCWLT
jgi:hypothetical protein